MKIKKRSKSSRMKGRKMGSHGHGFRKKAKGSGHRGGFGMAGTGKRGDQKKTLVLKLYGSGYFGKQGITSKRTEKDRRLRINLFQISENLRTFLEKGIAKKTKEGYEVNLEKYKILSQGEIKEKLIINAESASAKAIEKIKKLGGEIKIKEKKNIETPLVESPRVIEKKKKAEKK